jgi:hypothetical protein
MKDQGRGHGLYWSAVFSIISCMSLNNANIRFAEWKFAVRVWILNDEMI